MTKYIKKELTYQKLKMIEEYEKIKKKECPTPFVCVIKTYKQKKLKG